MDIEDKLALPLDIEREAWEASQHRFLIGGGHVHKVKLYRPAIYALSFLTGSSVETIYTNAGVAGAAKATFTSEFTINDTATMGAQPAIPPYFFLPQGPNGAGKAIRIVARGILSTTSNPQYTWSVRLGGAVSVAGPIVLGTVATAAATTVSNKGWELQGDVVCKTTSAEGANSTFQGAGMVFSPAGLPTPFMAELWGGAAQPGTVATVDISIVNHVNFNITCQTSSSSNSIQLLQLLVFGLN